ncbi:metal-dependent hydrolase [Natronincola ferrireducens]|uniref:Inner membrane protein n=1 Tax=Natronincola ferrireducens TaxID=393762 RepID=A0A1G8YMN4_9FIRM|nr:metal-dependent hydrolase [Natronincola ferrireducens]SDK04003.1 inner membrane protein [Natronincola ferrireducens]
MLARTHIALGMMTALFTAAYVGTSYFEGSKDFMTLLVVIIAALLPDLDMGTSSLAGKFGIIKANHIQRIWLGTLLILATLTVVYLRETPIFLGILFTLFLGAVFSKDFAQKGYYLLRNFVQAMVAIGFFGAAYYYKQPPLMGIGLILILLLFSKHRGLSHSIVFVIITFILVKSVSTYYDYRDYSILFTVSMISHILGDMFTKAGVMLLYPFNQKRIKFPLTIKTGGKLENVVFLLACFAAFRLIKLL